MNGKQDASGPGWAAGCGLEDILSNSQQFEVMYMGKMRLRQKRVTAAFIDEAVQNLRDDKEERSDDTDTSSSSASRKQPNMHKLHLPNVLSMNSQSLDETLRLSIMRDLHE